MDCWNFRSNTRAREGQMDFDPVFSEIQRGNQINQPGP
jgi:hypothetical protein